MSAAGCVTGRGADGAGRTGDAEAELVGELCEEALEQRALADAGGPGDDERAGEGSHKLCTERRDRRGRWQRAWPRWVS